MVLCITISGVPAKRRSVPNVATLPLRSQTRACTPCCSARAPPRRSPRAPPRPRPCPWRAVSALASARVWRGVSVLHVARIKYVPMAEAKADANSVFTELYSIHLPGIQHCDSTFLKVQGSIKRCVPPLARGNRRSSPSPWAVPRLAPDGQALGQARRRSPRSTLHLVAPPHRGSR
jgi:hypothetical protein